MNFVLLSMQRENKESRSPRAGAVDLPVVTDSIRNIKSMWEKGSVFNAPGNGGSAFKVIIIILRALYEAEQDEEGDEFYSLPALPLR